MEQCLAILSKKGPDYAGLEDVLHNFKQVAIDNGMTPFQVIVIYMAKHYDRIRNCVKSDPAYPVASGESIPESLKDLINYCILFECLLQEYKNDSSTEGKV